MSRNLRTHGVLALWMIIMSCLSARANEDPYEISNSPFYAYNLAIEWKVPADRLPKTVTIFAVRPQTFSPVAISNALQLGSLTFTNRVTPHLRHKGAWLFEQDNEVLSIAPSLATIYYDSGNAMTKGGITLPSPQEIRERALKIISDIKVDASELQTAREGKPVLGYDSRWAGYFDKGKKESVSQLYARSIHFRRIHENIPFHHQGIRVDFGHEGKVLQLNLFWQNLRPSETRSVSSPDQLIRWIKEGRARVSSATATGMQSRRVKEIKKLTITNAALWYFDTGSDARQKQIIPYGIFEATAVMTEGFEIPIVISCPVVPVSLPKAKRDTDSTFHFWPKGHPDGANPMGSPSSEIDPG